MFAREGYAFILGAAALAAIAFATALRLRSWPLWLVAIVLTVVALSVAWFFRNPTRLSEREANVALAPIGGAAVRTRNSAAKMHVTLAQHPLGGATTIAGLPVS